MRFFGFVCTLDWLPRAHASRGVLHALQSHRLEAEDAAGIIIINIIIKLAYAGITE
jgi:hypothetical protein